MILDCILPFPAGLLQNLLRGAEDRARGEAGAEPPRGLLPPGHRATATAANPPPEVQFRCADDARHLARRASSQLQRLDHGELPTRLLSQTIS